MLEFRSSPPSSPRSFRFAVLGFADLLLDQVKGPLTEPQKRYVTNIAASGKHLLSLMNDVLNLS